MINTFERGVSETNLSDIKLEFIGTFMFTWVLGWAYIHGQNLDETDAYAIPLAYMITVMLFIWTGDKKETGGHFNPIITAGMMATYR
jgi:glycerol uptake facilitator-like aquaporin